jgi:GntR family transcriptional regulator/MocR family aminotransferase
LQSCLQETFGERIQVREPEGGLALWVRFQDETDVDQLVKAAQGQGVVVRSARQFSPMNLPENALRLGFASLDRDEIRQATLRLARALNTR